MGSCILKLQKYNIYKYNIMRSLVFIALIGLALAVPVPKDAYNEENELWTDYEAQYDEDCVDTQPAYHPVDEIIMTQEEVLDEDCDGDIIDEKDLLEIDLDDIELEPANVPDDEMVFEIAQPSDDLVMQQNENESEEVFVEEYYDDCQEDDYGQAQTEAPVIITEPAVEIYDGCDGGEDAGNLEPEYEDLMNVKDVDVLAFAQKAEVEDDLYFAPDMGYEQEDCEEY